MTREEAIRLIGWLKCTTNREDDLEAIDMALESLQRDIERQEMVIRASERYLGVVRCKDCKYKRLYDERLYDEGDTKYYYCALEDRPNRNWSVDDTDYCSWGEEEE